MLTRKQAKIITAYEFLAKKEGNIVSCDIEDVLCGDYVYILDSMDMEEFDYEDTSFDVFKEIVFKEKVVGFVSYMDDKNGPLLMEIYVMPEYRGNNLLYEEISSKDNLKIHNPKIGVVKSLINCDMAYELDGGIVISKIPFDALFYQLPKDYSFDSYYSYIYDLNHGSVLFLDKDVFFNCSTPNKCDISRYNLIENIDEDYLNKVCEIVSKHDEKYLKVLTEKVKPNIIFV